MTATADEKRLAAPPRDGVRRIAPFALRTSEDVDGGGYTLDGYSAVFNRETIIDSWEGRFREKIALGAMKKSFRENPPRVQFDHGSHPLIGSIPIAALRAGYPREEADPELAPEGGAHLIADLHKNWLIEPVREAIASRSINGQSFRFGVVNEVWHDADGRQIKDQRELEDLLYRSWADNVPDEELLLRTLKELRVPEMGPVVWPAYTDTSVGVRSQTLTIDLARLHEPDQRSQLARAVLMADRVDGDDSPPLTSPEAERHEDEPDDTPQSTTREVAAKHESAVNVHDVRAELERMHANNAKAVRQKERYSS